VKFGIDALTEKASSSSIVVGCICKGVGDAAPSNLALVAVVDGGVIPPVPLMPMLPPCVGGGGAGGAGGVGMSKTGAGDVGAGADARGASDGVASAGTDVGSAGSTRVLDMRDPTNASTASASWHSCGS
jgi:hypothetical protein